MSQENKVYLNAASTLQELLPCEIVELLGKIALFADQGGHKIYLVGGFVRDLLLRQPNHDIDIAVEGDAIPFVTKLSEHLGLEFKVFDRFHTAKLYHQALTLDFSSTRREIYETPGALPKVTISNLFDDLHRRDFSINALAMSLSTEKGYQIIDHFNGIEDLKAGIVRILHPKSFVDDPTRLYRALRFAHRLEFKMDSDTQELFNTGVNKKFVQLLSMKRVASELEKFFYEPRPDALYQWAARHRLFSCFSNKARICPLNLENIAENQGIEVESLNLDLDAIYWTTFLFQMPPSFKMAATTDLGISHSTRQKVTEGLKGLRRIPAFLDSLSKHDHIKLYYLLSKQHLETLLALISLEATASQKEKIFHYLQNLMHIKPIINGKDLLALNIPTGPHIRAILDHILELKLEGKSLTKLEELEIARKLYSNIQI
jgi:tRNA nucleotidyltransferase (CCA-adding enzyme)